MDNAAPPFSPGISSSSPASGAVGAAPVWSTLTAKQKAIESHTFNEFCGPVYDQSGKVAIPKGKCLGIKDLYSMQWLVKGVIGSVSHVPPPG